MNPLRYNPDHKTVMDAMLLGVPGVEAGQMMGHPGYKIAGKMFAFLMEDGVAIKLPEEACRELLARPQVIPFAPGGGTPMRHWVQVNLPDAASYTGYQSYFELAVEFVLDQAGHH